MSYSFDVVNGAFKAFLKCRSLSGTCKELKKQGYQISLKTVDRWHKKYDWEYWCTERDDREKKYGGAVLDLDKELLMELLDDKDRISIALKECPIDSQLWFGKMGVVEKIIKLMEKKQTDYEQVVKEVIDMFREDPVAGPVVNARAEFVLKRLKKEKR